MHVLRGIDMHIKPGELVSIMGSSGSGKSTLLNILGLLDNYDSGEYMLNNILMRDLSQTKAAQLRNKFLGFVFQSFNLLAFKSAIENVALPLYYQKVNRKERNKLALEYLDRMGLKEWANHLPSEMSGGQKQRVAIARALIAKPKVIPCLFTSLNICITSCDVVESNAPVGSSAKITFGFAISARAMATRCFCPPLISLGR